MDIEEIPVEKYCIRCGHIEKAILLAESGNIAIGPMTGYCGKCNDLTEKELLERWQKVHPPQKTLIQRFRDYLKSLMGRSV